MVLCFVVHPSQREDHNAEPNGSPFFPTVRIRICACPLFQSFQELINRVVDIELHDEHPGNIVDVEDRVGIQTGVGEFITIPTLNGLLCF